MTGPPEDGSGVATRARSGLDDLAAALRVEHGQQKNVVAARHWMTLGMLSEAAKLQKRATVASRANPVVSGALRV